MNLLDEARKLKPVDCQRRNRWNEEYKETYMYLVNEVGMNGKMAVEWIAEKKKLSEDDARKLYEAAIKWNRKDDGGKAA